MIKIYEKLWYIVKNNSEDSLSYMCQYEENKSGKVSSNVKKMQETGRRWTNNAEDSLTGTIIANAPTKGVYVGNSVSRWSTSNKLFRVTDPRGFTVEIPTDNLATVLHHTTVVKGIIQEECVWGRIDGSHILLPVNSEPYKAAKEDQNTIKNELIDISNLKKGDWVRFFGRKDKFYFLGRVKITWDVYGCKNPTWYSGTREKEYSESYQIEDSKYVNLFLKTISYGSKDYYAETPTKPKIVEIIRNQPIEVDIDDVGWLIAPQRVLNKLDELVDLSYYPHRESKAIKFSYKGE